MMKLKRNEKFISLLLAALLLSSTTGCSFVAPNEGDDEPGTSNDNESFVSDTDTESEQAYQDDYLPIPEIILTQVDALPKSDSEAIFKASPIGWDAEFFVFEEGLTIYLRRYYSHECYIATLTLPEGITDGKILHISRGGGSGEVDILVKALNGEMEVYLNYYFSSLNVGEFVTPPQAAMVLEGIYLDHLLDSISPSVVNKAYNSYELDSLTWNTVEVQDSVNVAIKPEDIAREYNEITYNNMSFVIVDTKGSKTFAVIKTQEMYTGFREINPQYSNTVEWQTFENVLGNDGLRLTYAVGANASDICYFTFENGELLCCNINSEVQKIFTDSKQLWLHKGADKQYGSHDLMLTVDLSDTSEKYYGWIENGSLHLVNEKDIG